MIKLVDVQVAISRSDIVEPQEENGPKSTKWLRNSSKKCADGNSLQLGKPHVQRRGKQVVKRQTHQEALGKVVEK